MKNLCIWAVMLCVFPSWNDLGFAQTPLQTRKYINMTRDALHINELSALATALSKAEAALQSERSRMSDSEHANFQLWLFLFRSRYHQLQGKYPPITNVHQFEAKNALVDYMENFKKSIEHLKQAVKYLRYYNELYMQLAQRSQLERQIFLQASLSLERDLVGDIQTGEVYMAFLEYALQSWGDRKSIDRRFAEQQTSLSKLRERQKISEKEQQKLVQTQQQFVVAMSQAQQSYISSDIILNRQRQNSAILRWSGIGVASAGLGLLALGLVFVIQAHTDPNNSMLCDSKGLNHYNMTNYSGCHQYQLSTGYTVSGLSGGLVGVGGGLLVTGILLNPTRNTRDRAVLHSHSQFQQQLQKAPEPPSKSNNQTMLLLSD